MLAAVSGTVATVGLGVAYAQHSPQGGNAIVAEETWENHHEDRFRIYIERGIQELECRGQPREYQCYGIETECGCRHNLYVNPQRELELDDEDEWNEFREREGLECDDGAYANVTFAPAASDKSEREHEHDDHEYDDHEHNEHEHDDHEHDEHEHHEHTEHTDRADNSEQSPADERKGGSAFGSDA